MAENGNPTRPVRTLTVKNFSVIKEAKLEFGKITVLIGPQASGKSLLCKLAYFITSEVPILAVESAMSGQQFSVFESFVVQKFKGWFPLEGWGLDPIKIVYQARDYVVEFEGNRREAADQWLRVRFSRKLSDLYSELMQFTKNINPVGPPQLQDQKGWAWAKIMNLLDPAVIDMPLYVPAGRAFFVNSATGFAAIENPEIDQTVRLFAKEIAWNPHNWLPGTLSSGRGVTQQVNGAFEQLARGHVVMNGNVPAFQSVDGRVLPLSFLSSGTQELIPLFNVLQRLMYWQEHRAVYNEGARSFQGVAKSPGETRPFLYVEEPEANIFPSTQNGLVKLLTWLSNDPLLRFSWVITTHSPYILSAFDNLIKAGVVGNISKERHEAVSKIVDEKYWVRPEDFRAYKIADGNLESIYKEETGELDGDYLDDVSGAISEEFTNLLEIQYGG
jgi:hypothetical protein